MAAKREKNNSAAGKATIAISHRNLWEPEKHGPAFLKPLLEGLLKRLSQAGKL